MAGTVEFGVVADGNRFVLELAVEDSLAALYGAVEAKLGRAPDTFDLTVDGEVLQKEGCVGDTEVTAGCEVSVVPSDKAVARAELQMAGRNVEDRRFWSAVVAGNTELVSLYLRAGVESRAFCNPASWSTNHVLFEAAERGHSGCVALLLQHGCDAAMTEYGPGGRTPLHKAASRGHIECVRILLDHGASPHVPAGKTGTPLQMAAESGQHACLHPMLEDALVSDTAVAIALSRAASRGHIECVRILLDHGASPNVKEENGTALHMAAEFGQHACLKLLLEHGADTTVATARVGHSTALHCAASGGHIECLRLLLAAGASDFWTITGETALHLAAKGGHHECLKLLCPPGVNVNVRDYRGRTPLNLAKNEACKSILEERMACNEAYVNAHFLRIMVGPLYASSARSFNSQMPSYHLLPPPLSRPRLS